MQVFAASDTFRRFPFKCTCGSTDFDYVNTNEWLTPDKKIHKHMTNWKCAVCGEEAHSVECTRVGSR